MSKTPGFKRVFILTAEVFPGEQGVVEEQSNGRRCSPSTGAELLAGSPGLSLNSALILSKSMGPPQGADQDDAPIANPNRVTV